MEDPPQAVSRPELLARLAALLDPLGPAGDRRYRTAVFDHRSDRPVAAPVERAPRSALLLFDGVFLQRPELRDGFDLSIFVAVSFEEVLRRALERDVPLLGPRDEVERRYRTRSTRDGLW